MTLDVIRLKARVLAGQVYAGTFNIGGSLLRRIVPHDSALGAVKRRIAGWFRPQSKRKLAVMLEAFARAYPEARFVQIGSNDGMMEDPLRDSILKYRWQGVMVEPVPQLFERLRSNYVGRAGLSFENVAVSSAEGMLPFYRIADPSGVASLPVWAPGLGSFSREVLLSHRNRIPGIENYIVESQVPVVRFDTLCRRNGVQGIDLLHIDTEGHDYEILESIDLARLLPRVVVYERHHLTAAQQAACIARLEGLGYSCMHEGLDTFCVRIKDTSRRDAPLLAVWRALERIEEIPA